MGDVIEIGRAPLPRMHHATSPRGPQRRVCLREELRRVELVAALIRECDRRMAKRADMRCVIASTPKGAPPSERTWTVKLVEASGRKHDFFHPTHSDSIDMFAGAVRTGLDRWIDIVERRIAMKAVDRMDD